MKVPLIVSSDRSTVQLTVEALRGFSWIFVHKESFAYPYFTEPHVPALRRVKMVRGLRGGFLARRLAGLTCLGAGTLLLSISICGLVANLNLEPRSGDSFSSRLHAYVKTVSAINQFDPFEATMVVHENTRHSIERRIDWTENWLQWGLGKVYEPISKTQNTNRLISAGLADCSERAQILKSIAEQAGCDCRFVGLGGHVVLEIQTEKGPCIADPDYGCLYAGGLEDWVQESNSKDIYARLRKLGYPKAVILNYIDTVQSTDDNVSLEPGAPLSPRLYAIEQLCSYLIWAIPIGLFAIGCMLVQKQK